MHHRRFHPTPSWLVLGLLVVEGLLWLSERFGWFWFNEKKGWTVLIGVAAVGVAMLVMLLWFIVSLIFRLRFQFTIRSLLVLTVAVALPCSWLAVEMKKAREQRELFGTYEKAGGLLQYNVQDWRTGYSEKPVTRTPMLAWAEELLGTDFFQHVARACPHPNYRSDARFQRGITDEELAQLQRCTHLRVLDLEGFACVTDAGLVHLTVLTRLEEVNLRNTRVTDEGVKRLQQALPNCKIIR